MSLPSYDSPESAITGCFGEGVTISKRSYVGGGDINDAFCLDLSDGQRVFVKSNTLNNRTFFEAESKGLDAIAGTGAIRTPKLFCIGSDSRAGISFLMMEMIERGRPAGNCWEVFAQQLAAMHRADTTPLTPDGKFGFTADNYIGASRQINDCRDTWIGFFRDCRLAPQFEMAKGYFDSSISKKVIRFLDHLEDKLIEPPYPSLLHGDMWSGNIITGPDGLIMLIDPAVYVGHAEADLAMTELFGRLPHSFYKTYRECNPLQEGYEARRDIYNLYHLLNHLNLFGRSYLSAVLDIIGR